MPVEATEEASFPDSANNLESSTKRLAEWTFSLQGVGADLRQVVRELKAWVGAKMAHWSDEHPPPDPEREPRDRDLQKFAEGIAAVAAREAMRYAKVEVNSRHSEGGPKDGNGNGDKSWKDKIAFPLIVSAIVGAVVTYAKVGALETTMRNYHEEDLRRDQQRHEEYERRLTRLESKAFP
jgi:uncharacterized coiled-coil protein SlyX